MKIKISKVSVAVLSSLLMSSGYALASEATVIESIIAKSEAAVNSSAPQEWADLMYSDKVIVVGEGSPAAYRGLEALMPTIEGITGSVKSCTIKVTDSKLTEKMAWTFATWSCMPPEGEGFSVRALYVWEKERSDWKVSAEMYTMGEM